jgi:serine O-acetyltransferase
LCKKDGDSLFKLIKEDIQSVMERDPAARTAWEVFALYPGVHALMAHRLANRLYRKGHFFAARWLSQHSCRRTGIEIHPGAEIGKGLFIDHGVGIVIGETTTIGDNCTIYQGVTLGGTGKDKGKRHPSIGNNVMIGAGAKVLGPFTVGDNSKIAAGAVVLSEVPPNCTCVGVPGRIVKKDDISVFDLDQIHLPDPVAMELCKLKSRLDKLEKGESV